MSSHIIPRFLIPSISKSWQPSVQKSSFSIAVTLCQRRRTIDNNSNRGVAPLRRKAPVKPLSVAFNVKWEGLPKPVLDPTKRSKVETSPQHGLYGFFNNKNLLTNPKDEASHGRPWTAQELRHKSWEDIHSLWWICCRERNRIATEVTERKRLNLSKGQSESRTRDRMARATQKAIKIALTERWYAWEDAWQKAQNDPEIDLTAGALSQPIYTPLKDPNTSLYDSNAQSGVK